MRLFASPTSDDDVEMKDLKEKKRVTTCVYLENIKNSTVASTSIYLVLPCLAKS